MKTLLCLFVLGLSLHAGFKFEDIKIPETVDPQVGGLCTMPNGEIAACFHRGELMIYNPEKKSWRKFASGLHEPLGIIALSNSEFVVMQRPELTLIKDTTGDGKADSFDTIYDKFGMSGNYHEFSFGPVKDKEGNYYIALNVASGLASIRKEIRGDFSSVGASRKQFYAKDWKKQKNDVGRMFSKVPYRGWVLKISPEGKMTPISSGVRSPNGLGFDADGDLFVPDNQGDWLGTSKIHHIQKGHFHGHPASLVWEKDWDGRDPLKVPVDELDKMRTPAAALVPQGIMGNSPTQPLLIDHDKFGPFKGQMLIGEMNFQRVLRFMKDKVNGVTQGAIIPHIDGDPMRIGNNRLAWGQDGSLYIGRTKLSWPGDNGIQRVFWDGKADLAVQDVKLLKDGFKVSFTKELKGEPIATNFKIFSYHYLYQRAYGSPRIDEQEVKVQSVSLSADKKSLEVKIDQLSSGKVYDFKLSDFVSVDGESLQFGHFCYTLNQLVK
ncbi:MAG: PQQ-dependent sugar dehydrogenase [Lentisphaeraceae bacterium]|nr:PQQ-dependent sugar dehydrogenase [Lentisphaeraceae bacterium]